MREEVWARIYRLIYERSVSLTVRVMIKKILSQFHSDKLPMSNRSFRRLMFLKWLRILIGMPKLLRVIMNLKIKKLFKKCMLERVFNLRWKIIYSFSQNIFHTDVTSQINPWDYKFYFLKNSFYKNFFFWCRSRVVRRFLKK